MIILRCHCPSNRRVWRSDRGAIQPGRALPRHQGAAAANRRLAVEPAQTGVAGRAGP